MKNGFNKFNGKVFRIYYLYSPVQKYSYGVEDAEDGVYKRV